MRYDSLCQHLARRLLISLKGKDISDIRNDSAPPEHAEDQAKPAPDQNTGIQLLRKLLANTTEREHRHCKPHNRKEAKHEKRNQQILKVARINQQNSLRRTVRVDAAGRRRPLCVFPKQRQALFNAFKLIFHRLRRVHRRGAVGAPVRLVFETCREPIVVNGLPLDGRIHDPAWNLRPGRGLAPFKIDAHHHRHENGDKREHAARQQELHQPKSGFHLLLGIQMSEAFRSSQVIASSQRERSFGVGSKLFVPKENFAPISFASFRNCGRG